MKKIKLRKIIFLSLLIIMASLSLVFSFDFFKAEEEWIKGFNGQWQIKKIFNDFNPNHYGNVANPYEMIFKATRISKNKYTIHLKMSRESSLFGKTESQFYINGDLIKNAVDYISYNLEKDIELDEAKEKIKLKIRYVSHYGIYNPEDIREVTLDIFDKEDPVIRVNKINKGNFDIHISDNGYLTGSKLEIFKDEKTIKAINIEDESGKVNLTLEEGRYKARLTDKKGNYSEKYFSIDKTKPEIKINGNFAPNISYTNSNANIAIIEDNFSKLYVNGKDTYEEEGNIKKYKNRITLREEGGICFRS